MYIPRFKNLCAMTKDAVIVVVPFFATDALW